MEYDQGGDYKGAHGKTTIAPEVLLTIVQLTTLSVPGVNHMSDVPGGVNKLFRRDSSNGVRIDIQDGIVYADLHLVFNRDVNLREVGRKVQYDVSRAISEMVGMQVGRVNIHVEDIDYSDPAPKPAKAGGEGQGK